MRLPVRMFRLGIMAEMAIHSTGCSQVVSLIQQVVDYNSYICGDAQGPCDHPLPQLSESTQPEHIARQRTNPCSSPYGKLSCWQSSKA